MQSEDASPTRVSVIVICYNLEEYIGVSVRSVMDQTATNLRIIVVDDGSTDGSWPIIERLAAEDTRIVALRQPNSGSPAGARNSGLALADGEFICFLDGDDIYDADKVATQLAFFDAHPELDIVFHDMRLIGPEGEQLNEVYLRDADYVRQAESVLAPIAPGKYLGRANFFSFMTTRITGIHTSTIMVRRSALEAEGRCFSRDSDIGLADDIDMWFRLVRGRNVGFVDRPLSSYRRHARGLTNDAIRVLASGIAAHSRNLERAKSMLRPEEAKACHIRLARQYCYLGNALVRAGRISASRDCYRRSFRFRPGLRASLLWIKTFLPRSRPTP